MTRTQKPFITSFLAFLIWILISFTAFSQNSVEVLKKICLWDVTAGNNSKIYLIGSLHLMKGDSYPLDSRFEDAFNSVDAVVFETEIDSMDTIKIQNYMLSKAIYADTRTLQTELSDSLYAKLADVLFQFGIPIQNFDIFQPWFIGLTITALQMVQLEYNPELGIDRYFFARAKEHNKETIGLESAEYQIDLLSSLSDVDQELFLQQTIDESDQLENQLGEITNAWEIGDIDKLDLLNEGLREYPVLYEKLIVERNNNWLKQIEGYIGENRNILVIVGAAHFPGNDGLIYLLKEKGYQVSQY